MKSPRSRYGNNPRAAVCVIGFVLSMLLAGNAFAAIAIDQTVSKDQGTNSTTVATAAFTTKSTSELLLAFVCTDAPSTGTNTTVTGVAGGGLTWTLVRRTNTQLGTAEIWRAFAPALLTNATVTATLSRSTLSSLTVMTFSGVDTTGTGGSGAIGATGTANSSRGAPTASLITTRGNSLVVGVGDDWDNAISRTAGTGQTIVHTDLSPSGDTYWVQRQTSATLTSGTSVTINDTAPATDRYNLTIAEILSPVTTVPTITATAGSAQTAPINSTFTAALQATVKDASNNPVSGTLVTFTAPTSGPSGTFAGGVNTATTNTSGVATSALFTANTTAGSYSVTATASGVATPASFTLTNTAGPAASITATLGTPQSATVKVAFATTLQATVKDASNNPVSGVLVTFAAPATGASGTFAGGVNTATTNTSGVATAPVFTANATAGSYTVTAMAGTIGPASFLLTNNAGPAASITATLGTPQNTGIGSAFTTSLQATVTDASGNLLSAVPVTFTAPATGASGTFSNGTATITVNTTSNGIATASFTANNTAGSYTVAAKAGTIGPASFLLTNNAGTASIVTVSAGSPQSATINTAFAIALQAKVTDASSNPLTGIAVTFTAPGTGASGTFSNGTVTITVNTASNGIAAAPFTANGSTGGYSVTASAAGVGTTTSFTLTNTLASPASIAATAGTSQSATISMAFTTLLQATVRDAGSNPVSGVTVTFSAPLSGPSGTFAGGVNTAITDTNGNATAAAFTADTNAGTYTVTASVSGVSTPASFSLTNISGPAANIAATAGNSQTAPINTAFAAPLQATVTDSFNNPVSGVTVTFAAPTSGASGTFTGGVNTAITNTSGIAIAPAFTANATAGSYAVTATANGVATPVNFNLTNSPSAPAVLAIDATASGDGASATTTVATPAFSTKSGNELLLAFVSTDEAPSPAPNTTVTGISGGGLTWVLVYRTNVQNGDAEIWRAFAPTSLTNVTVTATVSQSIVSSITVVSFTGADTTGTNGSGAIGATGSGNAKTGAPTASLVTTRNSSWVFGVGTDYDNAISRVLGAGQTLVHQDLAKVNDTYWVQRMTTTTPTSGTTVTVNDTAPTSDRYDLSLVEVLPSTTGGGPTFSLSGTISPATAALVTLSAPGFTTQNTTADPSTGNYSFSGLPSNTYTVVPSENGLTFTPTSQSVPVSSANVTGINFTAQAVTPSPVTFIQSAVNGNESATSNMSVSFTSNNTAGDFLIVTGTAARPASTLTISDTLGNTYTAAMGPVTDTTQNVDVYIWYVASCKGGANTITITPSTTAALEIHASEWSGLATSSPVDQLSSATGNGASYSSGSKTTTTNGELVFGYGWAQNNSAVGTGFTQLSLVDGDPDEYQIQQTAGSVAATFTQPTGNWFAAMVTFKPSTGGGGGGNGLSINMISPAPNVTVSGMATVSATATDQNHSITGVQFLLDNNNLGTQATTAPYSITWDTTTATAGTHVLSAIMHDSASLTATASSIAVTVDNSGNTAVVGSWSAAVPIPAVAVNLILLKNNTVLFYQDGTTPTVWDYINNKFTNIPLSNVDIWCSGQTAMSDGRILVMGGYGGNNPNVGIANAEIFDPSNNSWTPVPNMKYLRWYPTATALTDGRVLVTAGWQTTNHSNAGIPEIYDPVANTWTQLTTANNPFETYPFIYMLSDGRLIHVGGSEYATDTETLNITTQTWSVVDARIIDGGSSSMYVPDKIMKAGSAADSQTVGASSNTTFVLDTTQASPAWQQTPSMAYPRSFMNLTSLPDGTVLATGGETDKNGGNIANAVYPAELWSPQTMTWTTMAAMHTPREYHSTAILLPDGRVMESGMGADQGLVPNEESAEFYSPAYLFKGARPTITQAPAQITYGQNFTITTPDAATITSAVLIRTGAPTHFFDQSTRFVPVTFQQTTGGLTIQAPAAATLAQPGYYMLFIVNSNGVPSVAPFVQLQ